MRKRRSSPKTDTTRPATPAKKTRQRGGRRIAPLELREFFTRAEICTRYGMSDKRLAEAIAKDKDLPVIFNGRYQIFPKQAFDEYYRAAATKRLNIHAA
jgi:hypothetical protein